MKRALLFIAAWGLCAPGLAAAGMALTLERLDGDEVAAVDAREARLLAIRVGEGEPPSPFLDPGPFRATWRGVLRLDARTKLTFRARGRGQIELTIGEKVFLQGAGEDLSAVEGITARVGKGENPIVVVYRSPPAGDAWLRVEWQSRDFDWEPVPPAALGMAEGGPPAALQRGQLLRRGRELVATRGCVRCHELPEATTAEHSMPELAAAAPDLDGIGSRLDPSWVERWVRDPRALRPQARMPAILAGDEQGARDVAAALAQLTGDSAGSGSPAPDPALAQAGGVVFARLGCIACHLLPSAGSAADADDRIPLEHVAWKWRLGALADFLREPAKHHRWTRMPDLGLSAEEARGVESFLRSGAPPTPAEAVGDGDPSRGKDILESTCLSCHSLAGRRAPPRAAPLAEIAGKSWTAGGCVAPTEAQRHLVPLYGFAPLDLAALELFRREGIASLGRHNAAESADRATADLRCDACHARDGDSSRWSRLQLEVLPLLADVPPPTLSQARPDLTWTGEKLRADWMEQLFAGTITESVRPWLEARMPAFPARATVLAHGLAAQHGVPAVDPAPAAAPDAALAELGRTLVSAEGGFACVTCHAIAGAEPLAHFEFGAIDFELAARRVRPDYFLRWVRKPQRIDPTSPMPAFVLDTGKTALTEVLGGEPAAQFGAIWEYLRTLAK